MKPGPFYPGLCARNTFSEQDTICFLKFIIWNSRSYPYSYGAGGILTTFLIGFHRSTRFAGMGPSILIAIHSGYGEFIRRYISRKLLSVQLQVYIVVYIIFVYKLLSPLFFLFLFRKFTCILFYIYEQREESYYISAIVIKIYFSIFAKKETKIFRFFLLFFYIYYESILRM